MSSAAAPPPPADDEEDVIDGVIRKSGCETAFRKFEDCMVDTDRDFRKCASFSKALAECMTKKNKDAAAAQANKS
eukprot:CAMPEP_0173386784 /NCGR_PEP_ID=MMETSP1356-20130122/9375_1 /TAXON_ID=77927 ORGANISM="Hemiselmis virescens, Strain PCC157" /NCGR_SAMPLE_ID=MMETSP1356 /ASSEMBLY_ACC=CAM_ASM_000847 /LENGTH=74 /DNA_ID=CAMNT_0014343155 /DNA_START=192 /DNA_END=416 /DNA_ORIENTATION=-